MKKFAKIDKVVALLNFVVILDTFAFPEARIPTIRDPTAKYIRALIKLESSRDPTRYHDVAVLKLEKRHKSVTFAAIIDQLLEKIPDNAVFLHSSFDEVSSYRIHAFSFFVIFTDIKDQVKKWSRYFFFKFSNFYRRWTFYFP